MDFVSPIIGVIVGYTIKPIGRLLSYVCFTRRNIQNLKSRVEILKDTKESVLHKVCEATRNAENIESGVQNWLTKADSIIEKSETLLNNLSQQGGLCLNLVRRHQLSRKVVKLGDEVVEIKNEGNFDRVSYCVALSEVESSKEKTSDFVNFESRKPTIDKITGALMDDNVHRIGVYGMGGVGKTMLVKEISKLAMEKKLFDEVLISTISQTPDLKRIQGQLGDKLGLKFEQETEEGRALMLHKRLKMKQKILIVLDDVWKQIDLETIGIPSISDHRGCKILFTSRDNSILLNDMCIDKNFEIKVLQEDETWNLFKKIAGEIVEIFDLKSIAIEIAKECAHLPIAIITIAKALRNKHSSIWKDALDQLRNPIVVNIRGMNEKVYSSLKLSYEQLDCEESKLLFLLCSMFPEDDEIDVEELHVYAMGMGFLHGVDTVAQARRRITKLVDDLISSSLLLDVSKNKGVYVKMHDLIRDVAILISSKNDHIRTLNFSKGLNESWSEKEMSGDHTVVYLNVEGLCNPPQKLMLPKVQLLVLCGPLLDVHEFSNTFLGQTTELKILKLNEMKFSLEVTPFLYSFAKLQALDLNWCELGNIDAIGELTSLEFLSFKESMIIQIPTTMSKLTRLKVLNLSCCHQLKVIPPNILSNLKNLEELYLERFDGWEREELNDGRRNASLSELTGLSHLCVLTLWIPDGTIMPKQLFSRLLNLETFKIFIGCKPIGCWKMEVSRTLGLKIETESCVDNEIKMLSKRSEELHLAGSIGSRVLPFELNGNESSYLRHLYIYDNSEFQHFFNYERNKLSLQKVLSNLEVLELKNLENLETMFHGVHNVRESHFYKLKKIKLLRCNKLEILFVDFSLNKFLRLEEMKISDCEMMKAIVVIESEKATNKIEFMNLKSLNLEGLPRLQSFFSKIEKHGQLCVDNFERDETSRCSNHDSFFNQWVSLPNLEQLKIKEAQNLKMIFHNILIPNSFSKLESLMIGECNNLEKVFPSNIISTFTCLKILRIKSCNLLEGVFEVQEPNAIQKNNDLLPSLRHLELIELPNLQYIWEKDPCELLKAKNLEILFISQCPKLKREYPINVLRQLKNLEIDLSELNEILKKEKSTQILEFDQLETSKAEIIQLRDGLHLFFKLENLKLHGSLDDRYTQLPIEIVQILHNLEVFEVRKALIEEVFSSERLDYSLEDWQNKKINLSSLSLYELPKLRHLCNEDLQKSSSILQNLRYLKVFGCGILNMILPSSMPFTNLAQLRVENCHQLTYLLNPSIGRRLVNLVVLAIEGCKRMTTVIAGGIELEENDEIIFNRLYRLQLKDFSKLTSFHSGKCPIRFPRLQSIYLENCPEMRSFSLGIIHKRSL
ncbi:probable disease resistance protein At4g27220 isoform X2 [Benincasa hispida]|uniref:probable disease resistance protein At4g27220 isoform X2 n=1 Tax=Benincasa hispida TaxID=102211 RepID=UPI001900D908|nr:probable disease resistance protein At4g27220 isoform X2 [Benincasa hispida]